MDTKRDRSLVYVTGLTPGEQADAIGRINENRMIIDWVRRSLHNRVASYRYALERLVIAVPSPRAVEAERTLTRTRHVVAEVDPVLAGCGGLGEVAAAPVDAGGRRLITK